VEPPPQTTGLSTNFTLTRNRSVNLAIKSKIMQTLTLSIEDCEFKPSIRLRRPAARSTTRNPERLKHISTMKPNVLARLRWNEGEIVASFGAADLIRHHDGRWELRGGSPSDHTAAREWCSLFQHEATFPSAPLPVTAPQSKASNAVHNHILIADDDSLVRSSLAAVLESEGYVVDEARNGTEAVTRAIEHSPDLVLLDLNMPHWDGWTAFSQLDRVTPLLPIIVITARPNQYEKAMRLGVDAFMEKPLDFPTLLEAIATLIKEEPARHIRRITDRKFVTRLLPTRAKEFRP
jgi:CheY-like chemotaxis protein